MKIIVAILLLISFPALATPKWVPLNTEQSSALAKEIANWENGQITIACADQAACGEVSHQIDKIFSAAHWKVIQIDHGGLGIDGVQGIRIDGCGPNPVVLAKSIEKVTPAHIALSTFACDDVNIDLIFGAVTGG